MMQIQDKQVQKMTVTARIIKADGTVVDLGKIYTYENTRLGRLKTFWRTLKNGSQYWISHRYQQIKRIWNRA